MRGLDGSKMRTRVKGRTSIEKSLHALHRRVYRFATCRDVTPQDYQWALDLCTSLQPFLARRASWMADVVPAMTDEERGRKLLVEFKADLQRLALTGDYGQRAGIVILGTLDVVEALMRRAVRVAPEQLPILLTRIGEMYAHVGQPLLEEKETESGHDVGPLH